MNFKDFKGFSRLGYGFHKLLEVEFADIALGFELGFIHIDRIDRQSEILRYVCRAVYAKSHQCEYSDFGGQFVAVERYLFVRVQKFVEFVDEVGEEFHENAVEAGIHPGMFASDPHVA